MPILPLIFNEYSRPSRRRSSIGLDWDDLFKPLTSVELVATRPRITRKRPWSAIASEVDAGTTTDKDKFQIHLDVQQFAPEEISVKIDSKNNIIVEGKHEEKEDEHGFVSRHFVRRYAVPEGHDTKNVTSTLSSDGVLTISAPRIDQAVKQQRTIPIQQTGVPAKPIQDKKEAKETEK